MHNELKFSLIYCFYSTNNCLGMFGRKYSYHDTFLKGKHLSQHFMAAICQVSSWIFTLSRYTVSKHTQIRSQTSLNVIFWTHGGWPCRSYPSYRHPFTNTGKKHTQDHISLLCRNANISNCTQIERASERENSSCTLIQM